MDRMAKFVSEDWSRLGDFVRRRRTALGMTQGQLAAAAGVSINTVGNVENGQRAQDLNLSKIARALGWLPDSFWLILEGGQPVVEEPAAEPVPNDALRVERPQGVTDTEWEQIKSDLISDLEKYLRYRGRPR